MPDQCQIVDFRRIFSLFEPADKISEGDVRYPQENGIDGWLGKIDRKKRRVISSDGGYYAAVKLLDLSDHLFGHGDIAGIGRHSYQARPELLQFGLKVMVDSHVQDLD